jgi:hypothetical protein
VATGDFITPPSDLPQLDFIHGSDIFLINENLAGRRFNQAV